MAKKSTAPQRNDELAIENEVEEKFTLARRIADEHFGSLRDNRAVREIYTYLKDAGEPGIKAFSVDLARTIERAKRAYATTAPSPEQVFDIMDAFLDDDEE
jgi:hypothetical protein